MGASFARCGHCFGVRARLKFRGRRDGQFQRKRGPLARAFAVDAQGAIHLFGGQRPTMQAETMAVLFGGESMAKYLFEPSLMVIVSLIFRLIFGANVHHNGTSRQNIFIAGPHQV